MPTPDNFPFYNIMEHNHWSDTHHIQRSHLHSVEEDYTKIKKVFGNHLRILPTTPLMVLNRWSTAVSLSTNSGSWRQSIDTSMVQNTQSWVPPNLWWQIQYVQYSVPTSLEFLRLVYLETHSQVSSSHICCKAIFHVPCLSAHPSCKQRYTPPFVLDYLLEDIYRSRQALKMEIVSLSRAKNMFVH